MRKLKNILFILIVVFFSSCEKNDTVRDMGESQGFVANVYMEEQSEILIAGKNFRLPVTYWLPNAEIDSLTLRETRDTTLEMSFKQIAGTSFAYGTQFLGNIDSNKIYKVYQHSEGNWSDEHYSYRIYADYNSNANMSAVYKENPAEINDFIMHPGSNSDSIISKITYDYVTQMTKEEQHRSLVSVYTQDGFDAIWGELSDDGKSDLFIDVIRKNYKTDELLAPYFPNQGEALYSASEIELIYLFATQRPLTIDGVVQFNENNDTLFLAKTPYYTDPEEISAMLDKSKLNSVGKVEVKSNLNYEKQFDDKFDIELDIESISPEDKVLLHKLFVEDIFVLDNETFNTYFIEGIVKKESVNLLVSKFKELGETNDNEKLYGFKPYLKRMFKVSLEFQVKPKNGYVGKSNIIGFRIK